MRFDTTERWLLAVCCAAQFMVILDLSIVNVALPSIQSSLGFSSVDLQWVVDAYAIVFAGFLMLGGRATDHLGHRRTLVAALAGFALASLVGGIAPDQTTLIAARAVQGLSGALMAAGSLAAITSTFAAGPARHRAVGLWGAMNGAGGAAGVFFGGLITQELGWRWILLVNVPIGVVAAAGAWFFVRDRRDKGAARAPFDFGGALTLTAGLVVLVWGIVNAGYLGWLDPAALGPILAGLALLSLFLAIETWVVKAPLVPLRELTMPVRIANVVVLLFSAALFPMWYVTSLYLQQVLARSPLAAGLAFLPMALTIMLTARRTGALVSRYGARPVLGSGLVLMTGGMLLLTRIGASGSAFWYVVLPGLLVALGIGLSVVSSTIAAVQGARPEQAGLSSGLVNTSRQIGGAIGIALLVSLASQRTSTLIGQGAAAAGALTSGFRLAYVIGAGLCAAAAVVAFTRLPVAAGAPQRRLRIGIVTILACFAVVDFAFAGGAGAPIGAYTTKGTWSFVSAPALHPPKIVATAPTDDTSLAPGYIMLANFYDLTSPPMAGQSGPLILDSQLRPVWFRPLPTDVVASNLSVQTFHGKPALAWWQGTITSTGQTETGEYVVLDDHYRQVATLAGADGWILTLHSFEIDGDDAWVTANRNVSMNLTKYGGAKNGALLDSAVQKYSLRTGKLLYSWDGLDHIPLSDSHTPPPPNGFPWDAYHVNSIDLEAGGKFLTSMRDTWAAYEVDAPTGRIDWTLGGKHSTFTFGPKSTFEWQHDVNVEGSEVTLFDDACCEITGAGTYLSPEGPSRGLVLHLDTARRTATFVRDYTHDGDVEAAYMGSVQTLSNGNVFVGWGAEPYFSEYSSSGRLLLDARFPSPDLTYRARLQPWSGTPANPPLATVRGTRTTATVYASWNGSTALAAWRVLGGPSRTSLRPLAVAPTTGFETAIRVPAGKAIYEVEALDASGKAIGRSQAARIAEPQQKGT